MTDEQNTGNKPKDPTKSNSSKKLSEMSEEELLIELAKKPVQYTGVDEEKLDARVPGTDFEGTVIEFDRTFQWIFTTPDHQILIEKVNSNPFTGEIHIKDKNLDPKTYPNNEQVINFVEGEMKGVK